MIMLGGSNVLDKMRTPDCFPDRLPEEDEGLISDNHHYATVGGGDPPILNSFN